MEEEIGMGSMNMEDLLNNMYPEGEKTFEEMAAGKEPPMTLEDFLTKAGAVGPDDLPVPNHFERFEAATTNTTATTSTTSARPKRPAPEGRAVAAEEMPMDKVSQQRQRRMIKNRESAARSRERKQAYTVELEALVMQLEEENARLVREEAERSRKRFNKLMENLVPVGEKQGSVPRAHRRVQSVGW